MKPKHSSGNLIDSKEVFNRNIRELYKNVGNQFNNDGAKADDFMINTETEPEEPKNINDAFLPLEKLIFRSELFDEIITKTSVPELISGEESRYKGVILYGPAGTGKTKILEAISQVYQNLGSAYIEGNISAMAEKWVSSFANNLDKFLDKALKKAKKIGKPVFVFIDEGTPLVSKADAGTSLSKYYQGAIDVIKRYTNNPELVIGITTNTTIENFDGPLIRDERMEAIEVGQPRRNEKKKLWELFIKDNGLINKPTDKQLEALTDAIPEPKENGAFIAEFTNCYLWNKKLKMIKEKSEKETIIEALKTGKIVTNDEVKSKITFKKLLEDVKAEVGKRYAHVKKETTMGFTGNINKGIQEPILEEKELAA